MTLRKLHAEYRMFRDDLEFSRRAALWELRPTRLRMIFALIHGNPVAYRLVINKDGAALMFEPGIHGALVAECTVYAPDALPVVRGWEPK